MPAARCWASTRARSSAPTCRRTYDELLNPRWKNVIAIDSNKIEWFAMLLKLKGRPFMEKLAAQNPTLRDGNTLVLQLLAAGEFPVAAGVYEYSVEDLKTKGAPVDWIGLEPVITYTVAVSLPSQPPRPFAAKLFIEWLLVEGRSGSRQSIRPRADPRRRRIKVRQDSQTAQATDDRRRPGSERSRGQRNFSQAVQVIFVFFAFFVVKLLLVFVTRTR